MAMKDGRAWTLVTLLAVLFSPALSSYLKNGGTGFGNYHKQPSHASHTSSWSHHTPATVPDYKPTYPTKPTVIPAAAPAPSHSYPPLHFGHGSFPPSGYPSSVGYPPVGYSLCVWPFAFSPAEHHKEEEEEKEELNCDKRVPSFTRRRFYSVYGPSFWNALNDRLKKEQCHKTSAKGCKQFQKDGPFQAIASYVANFCKQDFSNPDTLESLVLDYCEYHSRDEAVKGAYECTTNCRLADHLNQVCHVMKLVLDCPSGFVLRLNRCYRVFTRSGHGYNWAAGAVICEENGSQLVRINNEAENDVVLGLLQAVMDPGNAAWIGLNSYMTQTLEYHWLSSTEAVPGPTDPPVAGALYQNWDAPNEPSNNGGACGVMRLNAGDVGEWDDTGCAGGDYQGVRTFVCERRPNLILDHPVPAGSRAARILANDESAREDEEAVIAPSGSLAARILANDESAREDEEAAREAEETT